MFDDLRNKTAIITGAAQGIGKGILTDLVNHEVNVVLADIQEEKSKALADSLGKRVAFIRADLSLERDIQKIVEFSVKTFGGVDFLINNARPRLNRSFQDSPIEEILMDDWDIGLDVLLKAPALLTKYSLPYLRESNSASIVNIVSTNALYVSQQSMIYHVAKAGLIHLSRYLAASLGRSGIRVNAVAPGLVDIMDDQKPLTGIPLNKRVAELSVPLQRAATVDEIALTVLFLCSTSSSYTNGQVLILDGGLSVMEHFHLVRTALCTVPKDE